MVPGLVKVTYVYTLSFETGKDKQRDVTGRMTPSPGEALQHNRIGNVSGVVVKITAKECLSASRVACPGDRSVAAIVHATPVLSSTARQQLSKPSMS